jgi:hypothetical protein
LVDLSFQKDIQYVKDSPVKGWAGMPWRDALAVLEIRGKYTRDDPVQASWALQ